MSKLLDNISDSLIILSKETKNSEVIKNELRETLRDYDSFEKKLNEIPFQKYQAWIPNNAGILNWVRICRKLSFNTYFNSFFNLICKNINKISHLKHNFGVQRTLVILFLQKKNEILCTFKEVKL